MSNNPSISFTVTKEKRHEMDDYAHEKGFRTASDLARYAITQHMRRYPSSNGKRAGAVQPEQPGDK